MARAVNMIASAVEEHAPFPLNHIFSKWADYRGFAPTNRQFRSVRPSFNESVSHLRKIQRESLRLNDSFAQQHVAETRNGSSHRQARQLEALFGLGSGSSGLPFPFNLLSVFGLAKSSSSNSEEADFDVDGAATNEDAGSEEEVDVESAFKESGLTASEADRRMAAMVGPALPAPLDALVGAVFPFRSFEQDVETEARMDDSEQLDPVGEFKNSIAAIREQYNNDEVRLIQVMSVLLSHPRKNKFDHFYIYVIELNLIE